MTSIQCTFVTIATLQRYHDLVTCNITNYLRLSYPASALYWLPWPRPLHTLHLCKRSRGSWQSHPGHEVEIYLRPGETLALRVLYYTSYIVRWDTCFPSSTAKYFTDTYYVTGNEKFPHKFAFRMFSRFQIFKYFSRWYLRVNLREFL